jgi:hypothetical protein
MTDIDNLNADKVRALLASAVAGLSPKDRQEREAWCNATDNHGVRMFVGTYDDPDAIEFRWGNRQLAVVPAEALTGDGSIAGTFIPDIDEMDEEIQKLLGSVPDLTPDGPLARELPEAPDDVPTVPDDVPPVPDE